MLDTDILPQEASHILDFKDETLTPVKPQAIRKKTVTGHMPLRKKDTSESARSQQVRSLPILWPVYIHLIKVLQASKG